jgi:hypothetical protein
MYVEDPMLSGDAQNLSVLKGDGVVIVSTNCKAVCLVAGTEVSRISRTVN